MSDRKYQQCRMQLGRQETVGWIETRAAKVGAQVEFKGTDQLWTVVEVFEHTIDEAILKEHQQLNRNSLPSVEGMSR